MLFSLLKHYLDLCITETALKVSWSLYCFTACISHGVENYFLRLWGRGISDAILILHVYLYIYFVSVKHYCLYFSNIWTFTKLTLYSKSILIFELFQFFCIPWCWKLFWLWGTGNKWKFNQRYLVNEHNLYINCLYIFWSCMILKICTWIWFPPVSCVFCNV